MQIIICYVTVYITGEYCFPPKYQILSKIRKEFGSHWKHVGYNLGLEHSVLNVIELNSQDVEQRTFKMLEEWMQTNVKTCYCKLISAMLEEDLCQAVEILKQNIKSSKFFKPSACLFY